MYAYAVTVFEMVTRSRAWDVKLTHDDIKKFVIAGTRPKWPDRIAVSHGPAVMDLVDASWDQDPKKRPPFNKIKKVMEEQYSYIADP